MSDNFHRPTLSFPDRVYNATQVRLYGLRAVSQIIGPQLPFPPLKSKSHKPAKANIEVAVRVISSDAEVNDKTNAAISRLKTEHGVDDEALFSGIVSGKYDFDRVLPIGIAYQLSVNMKKLGTIVLSAAITLDEVLKKGKSISCGIIVGYAYEGHTYDLPKPKIMIIPTQPEAEIPEDDSGFKLKENEGYAVWILDKLDECVELEMNQGFVEQLVLDANLPGKRAPGMYAGRMMMGHRSGRLSE